MKHESKNDNESITSKTILKEILSQNDKTFSDKFHKFINSGDSILVSKKILSEEPTDHSRNRSRRYTGYFTFPEEFNEDTEQAIFINYYHFAKKIKKWEILIICLELCLFFIKFLIDLNVTDDSYLTPRSVWFICTNTQNLIYIVYFIYIFNVIQREQRHIMNKISYVNVIHHAMNGLIFCVLVTVMIILDIINITNKIYILFTTLANDILCYGFFLFTSFKSVNDRSGVSWLFTILYTVTLLLIFILNIVKEIKFCTTTVTETDITFIYQTLESVVVMLLVHMQLDISIGTIISKLLL